MSDKYLKHRVRDAIMNNIQRNLDYELYENQESTLWYDDAEMDRYNDKMDAIREEHDEIFESVSKADIEEMHDDDLKEQIIKNEKTEKKCECVCNVENMKLFNLFFNGEIEHTRDSKVAHVICSKCNKYSGSIYYTSTED